MNEVATNVVSIDNMKLQVDSDSSLFSDLLITDDLLRAVEVHNVPISIDAICMAVCEKGSIDVSINSRPITFHENHFSFLLPEHILEIHSGKMIRLKAIVFSNSFMHDLHIDPQSLIPMYSYIINYPHIELLPEDTKVVCQYFNLIKDTIGCDNSRKKREITLNLVSALMHKLSTLYKVNSREESRKERKNVICDKFMSLLAKHHSSERRVEFYADKLCITPKYLSSVLKSVTGRTVTSWIDTYTILEAKSLLKFSNLNIKEVAYRLSFPNPSFFSKYFKKHAGMSPTEYQNSSSSLPTGPVSSLPLETFPPVE